MSSRLRSSHPKKEASRYVDALTLDTRVDGSGTQTQIEFAQTDERSERLRF